MKVYFINVILIGILSSCITHNKEIKIALTDKVKINAIELIATDTLVNPSMNVEAYTQAVYQDSILIVWNRGNSNRPFLEFKKLDDNTLIKSFFQKGNGPDELLSFQYYLVDKSKMHLLDAVKGIVINIDVDSLLDNTCKINQDEFLISFGLKGPWVMNEKLFYHNTYVYENNEINLKVEGNKFIAKDAVREHINNLSQYKYRTTNINHGFVIVNEDIDRFIYFSNSQPKFEIFDTNLNRLKSVEFTHDLTEQKFIKSEYPNVTEYIFNSTIPEAFTTSWCDNTYIFVVYIGSKISTENGIYDKELLSQPSYILQFNWDGDLIQSYYLNYHIKSISVSNCGNWLYANIFDDEGDSYVVKYHIHNNY